MSEVLSALPGATGSADTRVSEAGLVGMVTLRGDLSDAKLRRAVSDVTGTAFPEQGKITWDGARGLGWMSPDELLILTGHGEAAGVVETLHTALDGQHVLAVNVSDARAVFDVEGPGWRDVVARLSPMDLRGFKTGDLRRTRFGQIAAAVWMTDDDCARIVCFRSVARYMFDLLETAAQAGRL